MTLRLLVLGCSISLSACCDAPLVESCNGDCPSYTAARRACDWDAGYQCGDYSVLVYGAPNFGRGDYFDGETLVASAEWSESGTCWFGPRIECEADRSVEPDCD